MVSGPSSLAASDRKVTWEHLFSPPSRHQAERAATRAQSRHFTLPRASVTWADKGLDDAWIV